MNFSEAFQQTKHLVHFSPDGQYLANCSTYRLIVRESRTLQIVNLHTCLDPVQHMSWSPDSLFIMCGMFKRGIVQVWSIEQPQWTCKIDEGSAGLVACVWAPDSRHILTTTDFQLRMTLWSLTTKTISYIKYPKLVQGGVDFSSNGKYMALAERRECKDHISLFDCTHWQLVRHFPVETSDLVGVAWSPDSNVLCVWDSVLDYKLHLYSIDGRCLASYSAYDHALGIKCVQWSPTSQFLAIGSYDQKLRILNHVTWKTVAEHFHSSVVEGQAGSMVVYSELEKKPSLPPGESLGGLMTTTKGGGGILSGRTPATFSTFYQIQSKYETLELPVTVPSVKPDPEKPNPKLGIGTIAFSPDSHYIASRNDNMPQAVWVWSVSGLKLSVLLLQASPVREFKWDPTQSRLAVCTANNRLYLWSPAGCVSVTVPVESSFSSQKIVWHPDGKSLALVSSSHFCICYMNKEGE